MAVKLAREAGQTGVWVHQWLLTNADNTGDAFYGATWSDKTVQISGTFDGATVVIEGDNSLDGDPDDYQPLNNARGDELSVTAAGLHAIEQNPIRMRPRVTGGGGGEAVVVKIAATGSKR